MKLYSAIDSPPSQAIQMLLKALDLPYELVEVDYCGGQHLTEEFGLMNPQKEIPVLDDDGFYLNEHVAIMKYLIAKYAPDSTLYPKDPKAQAIVNQRLCFNSGSLYVQIGLYALAPFWWAYEKTPQGLQKVHYVMNIFETYLQRANTKYFAGDSLTIADISYVASMICLEAIDFDFKNWPLISKWYATFKKENPDIWAVGEASMKQIHSYNVTPPDMSKITSHPYHPMYKK